MSSIKYRGIQFRIYPQDHKPAHCHAFLGETTVIVEILPEGKVQLADRSDAILPRGARRSDVKKILEAATACHMALLAAWEGMQP